MRLKDIDFKFTRRNYEAIQSKSQVLCEMLNNPKIHPRLSFESCGLFVDPESAYTLSMQYYEDNLEKINSNNPPKDDTEGGTDDENSNLDE